MAVAVGIDLGTTNSVISATVAGQPTVIPNAEGSRTTPSVVGFSKTGEVLVGEVAKRQAITNPDRTIRSVKRHMGTGWTVAANSTVTDFSRSFSAEGSANVPRYSGSPLTSSSRGRTGRFRARSSCDWYSLTGWISPTRYKPWGNHSSKSAFNRAFFGAAMVIAAFSLVPVMLGHLIDWSDEHFSDRADLMGGEREIP